MHQLWFLIYNLFIIPPLYLAILIGGVFHKKIARGIQGRKNLFHNLRDRTGRLPKHGLRCWVHVASVGEFEQAKPVIELAKKEIPDLSIVLSFFSPSGLENIKNFSTADIVCYLPFDSFFQSKRFIKLIAPNFVIITRHDIWPNFIWQAKTSGAHLLLIDASVSKKTSRFWPVIRNFNKDLFGAFDYILAISEDNKQRLQKIYPYPQRILISGDTRYDQVYKRTQETGKIDILLKSGYFKNKRVFIAGSTWPSDEKHVLPAVDSLLKRYDDFVAVIVPHEPTPSHVQSLLSHFQKLGISTARYTELDDKNPWQFRILIVDCLGILANIYAVGLVSYVGGSFVPGVHSVLEPASHGLAVLFGPRYHNSHEAEILIEHRAGFPVQNSKDVFAKLTELLDEPSKAAQVGAIAKNMVMENVGASAKTVQVIKEKILAAS